MFIRAILALILGQALAACAYRFTNQHISRPEGIKTVAVEAIYDTSREVLPHELLWRALQDSLAASGYVRLAPQSSADALVRAHIRSASVRATGDDTRNQAKDDPQLTSETPPPPAAFRPLAQAGRYRELGQLMMEVEIEVWSLRTRTMLFHQTYPLSGNFRAVHVVTNASVTNRPNDYLRYTESIEAAFGQLSQSVAQTFLRDFFVR